MEIKFNCTERKRLAQAIGMIVGATPNGSPSPLSLRDISPHCGESPEYQFMPTCAYKIGQHTLDKDGTLHFVETLCYSDEAEAQGFEVESIGEERNELTITMPLDFFDKTVFANLDRILENKGMLIKHALGTDSLKYTVTDTVVEFPWFTIETEHDADAYSRFISALCDMAKNQKRINNKPDTSDNEKYTFRCFLLRLGFIGTEFKTVRKVLLRKLSGSSAFRNGGANHAVSE